MKPVFDVLRQPLVIGTFVLSALIVVGFYFRSHWYYGDVEQVPEDLLHYTPTPAVSRRDPEVSKRRLPQKDGSATGSVSDSSEGTAVAADKIDDFSDFEDIPVYYFPDGTPVPDHLLIPNKWLDLHMEDFDALDSQELAEVEAHLRRVIEEVLANHNPNRPIGEIWDAYIDMERTRKAEDEAAGKNWLSGGSLGHTCFRIYNFPEIVQLKLSSGIEGERFHDMYMVDMGVFDPDWNLHRLPDGRPFRTESGYLYEFHLSAVDEEDIAINSRAFKVGHSGPNAQLVVVDLSETSDAELERLGGWNYNYHLYKGEGK